MITKLKSLVQTRQREFVRFAKFFVVGAFGAVVDFVTYNLVIRLFRLSPEVASVIALTVAIVSNFIWNRYWTYPDSRSKPVVKQFVQFFIINILAVVIRVPIIAWTKVPFAQLAGRVLPLEPEMAITLGYNISWALGVGIAMFWNFFINRIFTYSDVE
jgi:putative flippase GtrA